MGLGHGKNVVVKGNPVEEQQEHVKGHVDNMKEHIVLVLCCKAGAAGRLDTALVQENCTPLGHRCLWKETLDWCRICVLEFKYIIHNFNTLHT